MMATQALVERGGEITREEVIEALSGHVCRCTGYVKIIDAVTAAVNGDVSPGDEEADTVPGRRRPGQPRPRVRGMKAVGARLPRYDGLAHVTGRTQYVDDVRVPRHAVGEGRPLAAPLRATSSPSTRRRRRRCPACTRSSRTRTSPRTSTATSRRSASRPTSRCSPRSDVRWKGQVVAAVAAESEEAAQAAADAVRGRLRGARADLRHPHGGRPRRADSSTSGARCIRTSARTTTGACARATSTRPSRTPT